MVGKRYWLQRKVRTMRRMTPVATKHLPNSLSFNGIWRSSFRAMPRDTSTVFVIVSDRGTQTRAPSSANGFLRGSSSVVVIHGDSDVGGGRVGGLDSLAHWSNFYSKIISRLLLLNYSKHLPRAQGPLYNPHSQRLP